MYIISNAVNIIFCILNCILYIYMFIYVIYVSFILKYSPLHCDVCNVRQSNTNAELNLHRTKVENLSINKTLTLFFASMQALVFTS